MREFVEIACYFIFAMMWNLLAGYGGMVSIGQQAFFGLGGYAMLVLGNFAGVNPFVAVPLGALRAPRAIAVPVSFVAFRLAGRLLRDRHLGHRRGVPARRRQRLGGRRRLGHQPDGAARHREGDARDATFWIALACVVAAIALVYLFLRSKRGLALLAIRDNEVAAESQGIDVRGMKLAVYVVAAFGAGLAGALYFVGNLRISPDAAFSVNWTAFAIFMVVIGGIGRIEGPIVGALDLLGAQQVLQRLRHLVPARASGCWRSWSTLFFRQGLWGWAQQRYGWSLFPTQRRLA